LPQPAHRPGSWPTTPSGAPVIASVAPGWPLGRPGLRPDLPRSDREIGRPSPSADGGVEEFRELAPSLARNSATSARSTAWRRSKRGYPTIAVLSCSPISARTTRG
jgi:hypothetical protein